jgi:hypothetical protein
MFLKYFLFKKSLKKKKKLKMLLFGFLKKFLNILNVKIALFSLKKNFELINELVLHFGQITNVFYKNPLTGKSVYETTNHNISRFNSSLFFTFRGVGYNNAPKGKKKGRVKRKVLRKLFKLNKKID